MSAVKQCGICVRAQRFERRFLPRELPSGVKLPHSSSFTTQLVARHVLDATPTRAEWPTDPVTGQARTTLQNARLVLAADCFPPAGAAHSLGHRCQISWDRTVQVCCRQVRSLSM